MAYEAKLSELLAQLQDEGQVIDRVQVFRKDENVHLTMFYDTQDDECEDNCCECPFCPPSGQSRMFGYTIKLVDNDFDVEAEKKSILDGMAESKMVMNA